MVFCWFAALLSMIGYARAEIGQASGPADSQRLEGRWVRPDGGYILQLQDIKEDGRMTATYYNPKPINVARAEMGHREGTITLFVELRDINYPGSTYTLDYDPATDRLRGTYFQAAMGQTFAIEFVRVK